MAKGIGSDIIEIHRIKESLDRHGSHFLDRLFTSKEQDYCLRYKESASHFAGRFAAKEAVAKALGTGLGAKLQWLDIEILNNAEGKPVVTLSEKAKKEFSSPVIHLSISHAKEYAFAVALID